MKLNLILLWESAAADRDDRGWKPLPQKLDFITDRTAQRTVTRFLRAHQIANLKSVLIIDKINLCFTG
jgi:hypothetical protein